MGKKDQGSRFLTLATEIAGYPVTFKRVPGVAKRLAPIVPPDVDEGVPMAEEAVSKVVKQFRGTPIVINCDGGYKNGVGVTGFSVVAPSGENCWSKGVTMWVGLTMRANVWLWCMHCNEWSRRGGNVKGITFLLDRIARWR